MTLYSVDRVTLLSHLLQVPLKLPLLPSALGLALVEAASRPSSLSARLYYVSQSYSRAQPTHVDGVGYHLMRDSALTDQRQMHDRALLT